MSFEIGGDAGGGGVFSGSGTTGTITKFTGPTALGDSVITESAGLVGINVTPVGAALHILRTGQQLRLARDGTTRVGFTTTTNGDLIVDLDGSNADAVFINSATINANVSITSGLTGAGSVGFTLGNFDQGNVASIETANNILLLSTTNSAYSLQLRTGAGLQRMSISNTGNGIWNDSGNSVDFRFEGDTDINLLFLDGSADFIGMGTAGPTEKLDITGNLRLNTAGNGFRIAEGSNARMGVATLTAGTVTVSNTSITASTRILLTSNTDGGTPGFLRVSARTASTDFTITSSNGADTSTVAWFLMEPA